MIQILDFIFSKTSSNLNEKEGSSVYRIKLTQIKAGEGEGGRDGGEESGLNDGTKADIGLCWLL